MAIDWTPIEEGDSFTRTDLEDRLNSIRSHISGLQSQDIEDRSLGVEVVPSSVKSYSQKIVRSILRLSNSWVKWPGFPGRSGDGTTFIWAQDPQDSRLPIYWHDEGSGETSTVDGDSRSAWHGGSGAHTVGLSLELPSDNSAGFLVMGESNVRALWHNDYPEGFVNLHKAKMSPYFLLFSMLAVKVEHGVDSSSTRTDWFALRRTMRWVDSDTSWNTKHGTGSASNELAPGETGFSRIYRGDFGGYWPESEMPEYVDDAAAAVAHGANVWGCQTPWIEKNMAFRTFVSFDDLTGLYYATGSALTEARAYRKVKKATILYCFADCDGPTFLPASGLGTPSDTSFYTSAHNGTTLQARIDTRLLNLVEFNKGKLATSSFHYR